MGAEIPGGCARPTGGPVSEPVAETVSPQNEQKPKEKAMIQVGKKAPDFEAPGFHNGKFITEKLSEHLGKWTLLCFYPGDFTFV